MWDNGFGLDVKLEKILTNVILAVCIFEERAENVRIVYS